MTPTRLLDTREGQTTFDGFDQAVGRLNANSTYELNIAGRAGITQGAVAAVINMVAVNPAAPGYLTVWPCSDSKPLASALNYVTGEDNANEFSIPIGKAGDICIYAFSATDVVVDVYGYYITSSGGTGTPGQDGQDGADGADGQDAESPARVIWVADDGTGDFLKLSDALDSIDDATATKPYVIKIAPGTYTENSNVAMKNYVDVEGSGQDITTITCDCSSNVSPDASGAVISAGAINAEIRHLTINNTSGGGSFGNGLFTESVTDGSFSMLHVTATATGGSDHNSGVLNYLSSSPTMNNVTAIAEAADGKRNYGVYNISSSPTMNNVTATATGTSYSYGVYNTGSSPTMNNVTATGYSTDTSYGVFNNSSSPTMNDVTATGTGTGTGTGYSYGVLNGTGSSPTMNNVTATGTGGTGYSYGVYNTGSSPTMNNVTATATGTSTNAGVANISSVPVTMNNVTATATGGTGSYGVYNDDSTVKIRNSSLTGTFSIQTDGQQTAYLAHTTLDGTVGQVTECVGVYDALFVEIIC